MHWEPPATPLKVPAAQAAQLAEPALAAIDPAGQLAHGAPAAAAKVPATHGAQTVDAAKDDFPASQTTQAVAPGALWMVPAGQAAQLFAPVEGWYSPPGQLAHEFAPPPFWYRPGWHRAHADAAAVAPNIPAAHWAQPFELAPVAAMKVPCAQSMHRAWPAEGW